MLFIKEKKSFLSCDVKTVFIDSYKKTNKMVLQAMDHPVYFNMCSSLPELSNSFTYLDKYLQTKEDFAFAAEELCRVMHFTVSLQYTDDEMKLYSNLIANWLTSIEAKEVNEWFRANASNNESEFHLYLLQITSSLENALGNFYLTKSTPCPFLLKDLISSDQLKSIFGKEIMHILLVLFGGPLSINLRNLLWHGFLTEQELPKLYFSIALYLLVQMSIHIFDNKLLEEVIPRKLVSKIEKLAIMKEFFGFPMAIKNETENILLLFENSSFILSSAIFLFEYSLELFRCQRYGDCVILLLPQIESLLRCRYASCNNCPDRILTAQSCQFYTTIDDVVKECSSDGEMNKLRYHVGDHVLLVVLDLFTLPDGLRIRDHLSHGEMSSRDVDEYTASILIMLAVILSHDSSNHSLFSPDLKFICEESCICQGSETFTQVSMHLNSYQPLFHPLSFAKRNSLRCLDVCMNSDASPIPDLDISTVETELCDFIEGMTSHCVQSFACDISYCHECAREKQLHTLYRSHSNHVIIRQISSQILNVKSNLEDALQSRRDLYERRFMRSRQRKNFQRFLSCYPLLVKALKLLACYILSIIHDNTQLEAVPVRKLKALLKISENWVTFTSVEVNKWNECVALVINLSELLDTT